ncbi:MAG TPA: hypothetical protein PLJ33_00810 [Peptococcaceae bacterium]|jgi:hypothetical protein|nr:hypothetical protein [Peptococcaceae bacterium]HQD53377.1 hypothetical protein [Peptococcaceae bacterium]
MVHQQIQQIQQRINTVSQMASQLRQAEENNRQRLMQLVQEEAFAAQQMNRIQQLCQESISSLHSISQGTIMSPQSYHPSPQTSFYGHSYGQQQSPTALFNLATMSPDTYGNVMQYMGGQGGSNIGGTIGSGMTGTTAGMGSGMGTGIGPGMGAGMSSGIGTGISGPSGIATGMGGTSGMMGTQSSLSDITTMGPDVYQASREQLGKGSASISQIGQQAGISSGLSPQVGQQTGNTGMPKYNQ